MPFKDITPPPGEKISSSQTGLKVPDRPVIPFIRGDGTGPDIWAASVRVFDAAIEKGYGGKKKVSWFEVFAGQAAKDKFDTWLPDETAEAVRESPVRNRGESARVLGKRRRERFSERCTRRHWDQTGQLFRKRAFSP